jgi:hypothetical protein
MGDERRWAARYQFLDELWRGRDRIVCDRELEGALHAGRAEGPLADLLAGLVPGDGSSDRAWIALHNDRRAASFARERSGTVFVGLDEAAEIASDEAWSVAMVHLGSSSQAPQTRAELVQGRVESFLEVLGERLEDDPRRSVILSLVCGPDEDRSYELLAELVEELFGDARIYGLTRPGMAAFYDFGRLVTPAVSEDSAESSEAEIEVDNSLGSESPRFECFMAVVGARSPGEGVTFIELPAIGTDTSEATRAGDDEAGALRVQLAEAQRRVDLHAIEHQTMLEKLEHAEDRIGSLEEQLDQSVGESASVGGSGESSERIDELRAREQSLRWELEQRRGEIERLEARPVEALEAEVARLRAALDQAEERVDEARAALVEAQAGADIDEEELVNDALEDLAVLLDDADEPSPAQVREWRRARSRLEHLLRKLERGGQLSALELHRELAALQRLL